LVNSKENWKKTFSPNYSYSIGIEKQKMLYFTMGNCVDSSRNIVWQRDLFIKIYNAQLATRRGLFNSVFSWNCE